MFHDIMKKMNAQISTFLTKAYIEYKIFNNVEPNQVLKLLCSCTPSGPFPHHKHFLIIGVHIVEV